MLQRSFWGAARLLAATIIWALLASCGGSGGGADPVAPPVITQQPASQTVQEGGAVTFSVSVQSTASVTYQWLRNGVEIAGASGAAYTLVSAAQADNATQWSVRATNAGGATTSPAAVLTVRAAAGLSLFLGDEGIPGYADATGREARFAAISGLAVDAQGNVFAADQNNFALRKITAAGVVSTVAPASTATAATAGCYGFPYDVAMAGDGSLYVNYLGVAICRRGADGTWSQALTTAQAPAQWLARGPGNSLFLADAGRVWRYDPPSGLSLIAGSANPNRLPAQDGTGADARFATISGLAADAAGNIYASDANAGIRKVTQAGVVTTLAPLLSRGGYERLASDAAGNLVVVERGSADFPNGAGFRRISPSGQRSLLPGGDRLPRVIWPSSVALGADGTFYYSSTQGVGVIAADGTMSTLAGRFLGGANPPVDEQPLGVDGQGNVVTLNMSPPYVMRKYAPDGRLLGLGPNGVLTWSELPTAAAMDAAGNLYMGFARFLPQIPSLNWGTPTTSELYRVSPSGEVTLVFNRSLGQAGFVSPVRLATDAQGTLYIGDRNTDTVRRLMPDASTAVVGTADFSTFNAGSAMAADSSGNIVLGATDRTIQRLSATGVRTVIAGLAGATPEIVDGTGAAARFFSPSMGLVADGQGSVYVADGSTIRKVSPDGVVTTVAGVPGQNGARLGPLPAATGFVFNLVGRDDVLYFNSGGYAILRARMR